MKAPVFFTLIPLCLLAVVSCSSSKNLNTAIGKSDKLAIVKTTDGTYWAIPGWGMDSYKDGKLSVSRDIIIARGKAEGKIEWIAENLIGMRESQSGRFQQMGISSTETVNGKEVRYAIWDCFTGMTNKTISLDVESVITIKKGKFRRNERARTIIESE